MEQIAAITRLRWTLVIFLLSAQLADARSFVMSPMIHQSTDPIQVRYFGCEVSLTAGSSAILPDIEKNPSSIIFGIKFVEKLCDKNTVRCTSRKPGRSDYLWYDIELVLEGQEDEEIASKEPPRYHWIIKKRELDQVPLRIPESAIIVYLPADFIADLVDKQVPSAAGVFYLPVFTLKKEVTAQKLEACLNEINMRLIKDKRFFSNTTAIGTVPTTVQLLNS